MVIESDTAIHENRPAVHNAAVLILLQLLVVLLVLSSASLIGMAGVIFVSGQLLTLTIYLIDSSAP